jgi:hypothetical protein
MFTEGNLKKTKEVIEDDVELIVKRIEEIGSTCQ